MSSTGEVDMSGNSAATPRPVIVSPPVGDSGQANERHEYVTRALFVEPVNVDDIPSQHSCPLIFEPPMEGVYFDVPGSNGVISEQVFERSQLYRWIATRGSLRSSRDVSHPINRQFVLRLSAWNLVRPVNTDLQGLLHRERQALNLVMVDEDPITAENRILYDETMRALADRCVPFYFVLCIFLATTFHFYFLFHKFNSQARYHCRWRFIILLRQ